VVSALIAVVEEAYLRGEFMFISAALSGDLDLAVEAMTIPRASADERLAGGGRSGVPP